MAEDDGFGAEGAEGQASVFQRLALLDARGETGNQSGVSAEGLGGELKAGAGARGGLVEEQRHAALEEDAVAGERILIFECGGAAQDVIQRIQSEVVDGEQRAWIVRRAEAGTDGWCRDRRAVARVMGIFDSAFSRQLSAISHQLCFLDRPTSG